MFISTSQRHHLLNDSLGGVELRYCKHTLGHTEQERCKINMHTTWSVHNAEVIQSPVFKPLKYFAMSVFTAGYKTNVIFFAFYEGFNNF